MKKMKIPTDLIDWWAVRYAGLHEETGGVSLWSRKSASEKSIGCCAIKIV